MILAMLVYFGLDISAFHFSLARFLSCLPPCPPGPAHSSCGCVLAFQIWNLFKSLWFNVWKWTANNFESATTTTTRAALRTGRGHWEFKLKLELPLPPPWDKDETVGNVNECGKGNENVDEDEDDNDDKFFSHAQPFSTDEFIVQSKDDSTSICG